ncbi:hypothetical protein FBU30_007544 [Linnemannia zychae]|nr:hypothetical protein FBU30_007544 [Linnemannia zychae]
MQHDSVASTISSATPGTAAVYALYSRILGDPQANADKAINTFQEEFEAKKTLFAEKDNEAIVALRCAPTQLNNAKEHLESDISSTQSAAKLTAAKLQELQQSIAVNKQNLENSKNPTRSAKEAFLKDITDAKEAFDQEMALRHADVVKQYVGAFVQQIDHY